MDSPFLYQLHKTLRYEKMKKAIFDTKIIEIEIRIESIFILVLVFVIFVYKINNDDKEESQIS